MTVNPIASANAQLTALPTNRPAAVADSAAADALKAQQARRPQSTTSTQPGSNLHARPSDLAESSPPDRQELERALQEVRKVVEPVARNLQFSIDDETGRTLVKVVDSATKEVIRQIPSEEILSIAKALDKLKGLLIRQEA